MLPSLRPRRAVHSGCLATVSALTSSLLISSLLASLLALPAAAAPGITPLPGHIPAAISHARAVDHLSAARPVSLALTLPLRNQAELDDFLARVADPHDPLYGKYLSPAEFVTRFSPTAADYDRVAAWARASGMTVTGTHPNRTVLDVSAPAATVEQAFHTNLLVYQSQTDGRTFYAPASEPSLPSSVASLVSGVVGLDNASVWRPHNRVLPTSDAPDLSGPAGPQAWLQSQQLPLAGTGPYGGLTPANIKAAYNLSNVAQTGKGQTLGLFELDGYKAADIASYEKSYNLPAVPLQNIYVDGYNGASGSGAGEVTLDIELQIALAPAATKVIVYEAPNSDMGVVDTYNRIATDDLAQEISTSWGEPENYASASVRDSEQSAFKQMAAQNQSIYAAAGDSGAYDDGSTLSVDDPASQPYMVAVGGTKLATAGSGGPYQSETTWNNGMGNGAGGGGISTVWPIPSYQAGVVSAASQGSTTMRNVPDVSLDADPNTGYSIYFQGRWTVYGGTSCAAPLWAAFTALVNQQRTTNGAAPLGFANIPIYTLAQSSAYTADFHDIADGSTNLYYPAVPGYDDATGWGTFNGANLLTALVGGGMPAPTPPPAPANVKAMGGNGSVALTWSASTGASSYIVYRSTASGTETPLQSGITTTGYTDTAVTAGTTYYYQVAAVNSVGTGGKSGEVTATPQAAPTSMQLLGNPGFEFGSASPAPWSVTAGVIDNSTAQPAHAGTWKAWLDGYGRTHTDTLSQNVALPASITSASLSFYLHIDTAESGTKANDTLKVQLRNSSGAVLTTLATYSNLNAASGYVLKSFDVSAYKGQTVQVYLVGTENNSLQTSFVVDDFALTVQ